MRAWRSPTCSTTCSGPRAAGPRSVARRGRARRSRIPAAEPADGGATEQLLPVGGEPGLRLAVARVRRRAGRRSEIDEAAGAQRECVGAALSARRRVRGSARTRWSCRGTAGSAPPPGRHPDSTAHPAGGSRPAAGRRPGSSGAERCRRRPSPRSRCGRSRRSARPTPAARPRGRRPRPRAGPAGPANSAHGPRIPASESPVASCTALHGATALRPGAETPVSEPGDAPAMRPA